MKEVKNDPNALMHTLSLDDFCEFAKNREHCVNITNIPLHTLRIGQPPIGYVNDDWLKWV